MLASSFDQRSIGFFVGGSGERRWFSHGGANVGYRCLLVAYEQSEGAIVMTSGEIGDALVQDIIRTIARETVRRITAPPCAR